MEKLINEKGELVLKREPWMQQVLTSTYSKMIVVAILSPNGLNGAWECAISDHLKSLWKNPVNYPYIKQLLDETGVEGVTTHAFDQASKLILNSQIVKS